jgi:flagellin-like protein
MITAFKIMKSRKGISPILATLLLIVIAVAAIAVTYAWIMTYMGNTTDKAGVMLYEANTNFVSTPSKSVTIDIGNSGTSDATVIAIYAGNSATSMTSQTITSHEVTAGGFYSFSVPFSTWASGTTYYFKVVPSSGQPLTFTAKAP